MRDGSDGITAAIEGGRVVSPEGIVEGTVLLSGERITGIGEAPAGVERIDAAGRLVAPGIVDIHGDAFERQLMPRPRTTFSPEIALTETDRQMRANGITTAFYGVSVSWEPGIRGPESAREIIEALTRLQPHFSVDTRLHIRWETFALDAVDTVIGWMDGPSAPIIAFNDHTTPEIHTPPPPHKREVHAARAGLSVAEYEAMMDRVWERRDEVPAAIERVAAAARERGAVLLAHDERTVAERERYRALGAVTSEFPMTRETAMAAREAGEHTILGAPNVVRGGSHNGMMSAGPAAKEGLCTVLTSDYYYPAPLHAAFRLVREGMAMTEAWALVSTNAAEAAGLPDRGRIAEGQRADLVIIDDSLPELPRVTASYVAGRQVYAGA
ncbi:MAG: alpha-D-ribose 1-methylphosphonate 5-triphosphate diphosphatase [Pseudomonadota bacterium]